MANIVQVCKYMDHVKVELVLDHMGLIPSLVTPCFDFMITFKGLAASRGLNLMLKIKNAIITTFTMLERALPKTMFCFIRRGCVFFMFHKCTRNWVFIEIIKQPHPKVVKHDTMAFFFSFLFFFFNLTLTLYIT